MKLICIRLLGNTSSYGTRTITTFTKKDHIGWIWQLPNWSNTCFHFFSHRSRIWRVLGKFKRNPLPCTLAVLPKLFSFGSSFFSDVFLLANQFWKRTHLAAWKAAVMFRTVCWIVTSIFYNYGIRLALYQQHIKLGLLKTFQIKH